MIGGFQWNSEDQNDNCSAIGKDQVQEISTGNKDCIDVCTPGYMSYALVKNFSTVFSHLETFPESDIKASRLIWQKNLKAT